MSYCLFFLLLSVIVDHSIIIPCDAVGNFIGVTCAFKIKENPISVLRNTSVYVLPKVVI